MFSDGKVHFPREKNANYGAVLSPFSAIICEQAKKEICSPFCLVSGTLIGIKISDKLTELWTFPIPPLGVGKVHVTRKER